MLGSVLVSSVVAATLFSGVNGVGWWRSVVSAEATQFIVSVHIHIELLLQFIITLFYK